MAFWFTFFANIIILSINIVEKWFLVVFNIKVKAINIGTGKKLYVKQYDGVKLYFNLMPIWYSIDADGYEIIEKQDKSPTGFHLLAFYKKALIAAIQWVVPILIYICLVKESPVELLTQLHKAMWFLDDIGTFKHYLDAKNSFAQGVYYSLTMLTMFGIIRFCGFITFATKEDMQENIIFKIFSLPILGLIIYFLIGIVVFVILIFRLFYLMDELVINVLMGIAGHWAFCVIAGFIIELYVRKRVHTT